MLIELSIYKMAAQHETYPATDQRNSPVSRQILLIPNLEVRDRLAESEINKLLHMLNNKERSRFFLLGPIHLTFVRKINKVLYNDLLFDKAFFYRIRFVEWFFFFFFLIFPIVFITTLLVTYGNK